MTHVRYTVAASPHYCLTRDKASARPLCFVRSEEERLYQISRVIEGVSACLIDYSSCPGPIELFDVMELVGRLDFAVDSIRLISGASP
jgi:hypothetical protein